MHESPIDQVDAQYAESLLLARGGRVQQVDVDDDLRGCVAGVSLESDAHPPPSVPWVPVTDGGHCVAKGEEGRCPSSGRRQTLQQLPELVPEHACQALTTDVALGRAVQRVADRGVVRRDGLGYSPSSTPHTEKPA